MDKVWHGEFAAAFNHFNASFRHKWTLYAADLYKEEFDLTTPGWRQFKDSAKVRFLCQVNAALSSTAFNSPSTSTSENASL